MTRDDTVASADVGERGRWHGKSILAGLIGSIIASFCCLPAATAIALGLSLSTAATLGQLLAFQRYFQLAGLAAAGLAIWWIVRQSRKTCSVLEQEHRRKWVPLYVFGAFAIGMVVLNGAIIPLLEQLPWLIS